MYAPLCSLRASLIAQSVKNLPEMHETWVRSLGQEDPPEKEMATHSSILAWRIPWREKPGRTPSMGSQELDMTEQITFFNKYTYTNIYIYLHKPLHTNTRIYIHPYNIHSYVCMYVFLKSSIFLELCLCFKYLASLLQ